MVNLNRVAKNDGVTVTRNLLQQPVTMSHSRVLLGQRAKDAIEHLCETDDRNMQKVGAANLNLNNLYCESIIKQANRSFWSALVAAVVGLIFFLGAAAFLLLS